jgi:hypothetical protein
MNSVARTMKLNIRKIFSSELLSIESAADHSSLKSTLMLFVDRRVSIKQMRLLAARPSVRF